jgi:putative phosphoesterase
VRIAALADTHGELPPHLLALIAGAAHVLHAGDVGSMAVVEALARIARTTAVRGNSEPAGRTRSLPWSAAVEIGGARLYLLHDLGELDLDPAAAGFAAVVHGHTHRPEIARRDGVLYVNPGSPVRPRGGTAPSIARLIVDRGVVAAEIVALG